MFTPKQLTYSFLIALSLFVLACSGAKEEKSENAEVIEEAEVAEGEPLTPEGYQVMATDTLVTDGKTFVINALQQIDEDSLVSEFQEVARPLVILEKKGDAFELVGRNDKVLICGACGGMMGDPWDGMYMYSNGFSVNHAGGSSHRWTRNIEFKYDAARKGWFMISDRGGSYSSFDPQNTFEESIYTEGDSLGTVPFVEFETKF